MVYYCFTYMTGINNVSLASGVITADGRDGPVVIMAFLVAVMWPMDVKIIADYGSFAWVYIWIIYGHYYTGFIDYSWLWPNVYLDIFGWFPIWWTWWIILCKKMKLDRLSQWNCTWTTPTYKAQNEVYNLLLSKCDESPSTRCSQLQWIGFHILEE